MRQYNMTFDLTKNYAEFAYVPMQIEQLFQSKTQRFQSWVLFLLFADNILVFYSCDLEIKPSSCRLYISSSQSGVVHNTRNLSQSLDVRFRAGVSRNIPNTQKKYEHVKYNGKNFQAKWLQEPLAQKKRNYKVNIFIIYNAEYTQSCNSAPTKTHLQTHINTLYQQKKKYVLVCGQAQLPQEFV